MYRKHNQEPTSRTLALAEVRTALGTIWGLRRVEADGAFKGRAGHNAQFEGTGQRADSVHLVEKLCSFYHLDIHKHTRERAGHEGPRGISSGCEIHSARTLEGGRHDTNCIKQEYRRSARLLPLE